MTLNELKVGETAAITAVGGDGALRCRLLDMGLTPRTLVTLRKVAPMGDPVQIALRGYELTLRLEEAKWIEIENVHTDPVPVHGKEPRIQPIPHPGVGEKQGREVHLKEGKLTFAVSAPSVCSIIEAM